MSDTNLIQAFTAALEDSNQKLLPFWKVLEGEENARTVRQLLKQQMYRNQTLVQLAEHLEQVQDSITLKERYEKCLSRARVQELALTAGFKLKDQGEGQKDLHEYVYRFARMIESEARLAQADFHALADETQEDKERMSLFRVGGLFQGSMEAIMEIADHSEELDICPDDIGVQVVVDELRNDGFTHSARVVEALQERAKKYRDELESLKGGGY